MGRASLGGKGCDDREIGPGARAWPVEAAAVGAQRVRSKVAEAVELAALTGTDAVDDALLTAASAGRFADKDLLSTLTFRAGGGAGGVVADPAHALQPGTAGWAGFTTTGGVA